MMTDAEDDEASDDDLTRDLHVPGQISGHQFKRTSPSTVAPTAEHLSVSSGHLASPAGNLIFSSGLLPGGIVRLLGLHMQ
jgi:hypothetical protein